MSPMTSMCGLNCSDCDAFIATQNNDDEKRAEVAKTWSEQYKAEIKPEDINCDGCISDSDRHFMHCQICEIRKCGKEKDIMNCAHCNEYACEKLEEFFKMVPDAKTNLDMIKSGL